MNLAYGLHAHEQKQACVHTPKKDILKKFCVYKQAILYGLISEIFDLANVIKEQDFLMKLNVVNA